MNLLKTLFDFYRRPAVLAMVLVSALAFSGVAAAGGSLADGVSTALIINAANLSDMFRGFRTAYNMGFREANPTWNQVATLVPSTTAEERYGWLGQFPKLREWVGDRHVKNLEAHDYTIRNKKYEATVGVPRPSIEDDQYGIYSAIFQEMGHAAATHPDELVYSLLAAGFDTTAYDGQYFFDTDHPVGGQSVSNVQTGAGNPWFLLDTRRMLKPLIFQRRRDYDLRNMNAPDDEQVFMRDEYRYGVDARVNVGFGFWQMAYASKADLTGANLNQGIQAMMAVKSDEGRPLGIMPSLLVVGPSNREAALEVVRAERNAQGATNINRNAVDILVTPWLQ